MSPHFSRSSTGSELYAKYYRGVVYVDVELPNGDRSIGSAFHVGENTWITAAHVVRGNRVVEIGTTESWEGKQWVDRLERLETHDGAGFRMPYRRFSLVSGPFYHPDPAVDVAAMRLAGPDDCPTLPLGGYLDDWLNDTFVLSSGILLGYPPVPFSKRPNLLACRAEVNAIVDRYNCKHPFFIASAMARGGFSGGPFISEMDFVLGMMSDSAVADQSAAELGFLSAISVEPIYDCLAHHRMLPACQLQGFGPSHPWEDKAEI